MPGETEGEALPWAAQGGSWARRALSISPPVIPQEGVNKKQRRDAPSEEDDSGVEVYYREGEEEIAERSVLPKVRGRTERGHAGAAPGRAALDSCLRAGRSGTILFLGFCKTGRDGAAGFFHRPRAP